MDNEIAFNEAIIDEREQGIQEIQQQIGEVNEIFKDLAVLVHDQGVMIGNSSDLFCLDFTILFLIRPAKLLVQSVSSDDISSNIDGAQAATAQAKSQLAKASKTQRSNSSLVILKTVELFFLKCIIPQHEALLTSGHLCPVMGSW